ncbi:MULTISPECIES: VOC family protein [unclassified Pseudonocardia]|jgi:uncharacterized glyoxalase superfamily protein PhnB|uniref:VOC family protein n=1 Tax=unclassified Pseudonocardia TaxID=2619320 RepID=UPI0009626AB1|nr:MULTISPECIES: VOC family protein [unclassified Pseudonocardia]MBN9100537.1 VOC family protein [Pseudonocardia sp.]OJY47525.1 MAG: glyoxalase [Pseudonocardia sp. 73-21]
MTHILGLHARLVVDDADEALAFYAAAFDAEVSERHVIDGKVVHSIVTAGPVRFAVRDAGYGDAGPDGDSTPVIMSLDVSDADAVAERMLAAGATVVHPVSDHDYGDRGGRLRDPFGHQWTVSARR